MYTVGTLAKGMINSCIQDHAHAYHPAHTHIHISFHVCLLVSLEMFLQSYSCLKNYLNNVQNILSEYNIYSIVKKKRFDIFLTHFKRMHNISFLLILIIKSFFTDLMTECIFLIYIEMLNLIIQRMNFSKFYQA